MTIMQLIIFVLHLFGGILALEWWESANYYQIYPKSFLDADNDGTGDLQGIRSKIPYLKELGMDAVWLSPCFNSSWIDGGYDISNFRLIDPIFGTMKDFDDLLVTCKENDVKLILDFVPNHTSNEHEWFIKSEARVPGYEDYYLWHPGKPNPAGGRNLVPNNWNSGFRGSAWQWSEVRGEYYYHMFASAQPDLNYRNPAVVEEMKNVLKFWLDKGVDGFRVDAIQHLFEAEKDNEGNYPDEPPSGSCQEDPLQYCYLEHIYTQNYEETYDIVYQWRELLDSYKDSPRIMMTEAYTALDKLMKYYGDGKRNGSHIPFNFEVLLATIYESSPRDLKLVSENYMNHIPLGYLPNWVLGNHDKRRIASRLGGAARAELYNFYLQTMPGHAITYQGEEIMMEDVHISWEDTQDPSACNTNETIYDEFSRDPARTPMQWNSNINAGFNNGTKPWLPIALNFREVNVAKQESESNSHLNIFKKLVKLHKLPAFREGLYESSRGFDDNIYSYVRSNGDQSYLIALNFANKCKTVNFSKIYRSLKPHGEVIVASLNSNIKEKQILKIDDFIVLGAESGIVLKLNSATTHLISSFMVSLSIIITSINHF